MARDGFDELGVEAVDPYAALGVVTPELEPGTTDRISFGKGSVQLEQPITNERALARQEAVRVRREEEAGRDRSILRNVATAAAGALPVNRIASTLADPGTRRIAADSLTFGAGPQIRGAGLALAQALGLSPGREGESIANRYSRERDVSRELVDLERADRGFVGSLPADLVGGLPWAGVGAAASAGRAAATRAPSWIRDLTSAAGWGAGLSGLYGFNRETGTWEDKLASAAGHGLAGGLLGAGTYGGIRGTIGAANLARRLPEVLMGRNAAARARVADWEALGETPPAVLALSEGRQRFPAQLSRNILGEEVRQDVARGTRALETNLDEALRFGGGRRTASDAGTEAQELTRRGLTARREDLATLTSEELGAISGVRPIERFETGPGPRRAPTARAVAPEDILRFEARRDRISNRGGPTRRGISYEEMLAEELATARASRATPRSFAPSEPEIRRYTRQTPERKVSANWRDEPYTAQELARIRQARATVRTSLASRSALNELKAQHARLVGRFNALTAGLAETPAKGVLRSGAGQRRHTRAAYQAQIDATMREIKRIENRIASNPLQSARANLKDFSSAADTAREQRFGARQQAIEREEATRAATARRGATRAAEADIRRQRTESDIAGRQEDLRIAQRNVKARRATAARVAAQKTKERQARLDLQYAQQQARQSIRLEAAHPPVKLPRSRESLATQTAAGELALARNAPRDNTPLIPPHGQRSDSALVGSLREIALEARSALHPELKGYRPEQLINPETGVLHEGFRAYLKRTVGERLAGIIGRLSEQSAFGGPFAQGARGTDRILTELANLRGRRGIDQDILRRITRGVEDDLERVLSTTPEGQLWLRQRREFRGEVAKLTQEIEAPLTAVTGNPNPAAALKLLQESTRAGGNIRVLDAFLRLADEKGDRNVAVSLLLQGLSDGGIHSFARNYRALTPEAKNLLFAGPLQALGNRLERLANASGTLARFEGRTGSLRARDFLRLSHVGPVALAVMQPTLWPALIKLAVGAKIADKVLASARFRNWMLRLPIEAGVDSSAWRRHLALFSGLTGAELGIDEGTASKVKRVVTSSISPARAEAASLRPGVVSTDDEARGYPDLDPGGKAEIDMTGTGVIIDPTKLEGRLEEGRGRLGIPREIQRFERQETLPDLEHPRLEREQPVRFEPTRTERSPNKGSTQEIAPSEATAPLHELGLVERARRVLTGQFTAAEYAELMRRGFIQNVTDIVEHPESFIGPGRLGVARVRGTAPNSFWTQERLDRLAELWRSGTSVPEIAREFGRTPAMIESATRRYRDLLGLESRPMGHRQPVPENRNADIRRRVLAGESVEALAREYGLSVSVTQDIAYATGVGREAGLIPRETLENVFRLWREGTPSSRIEEITGIRDISSIIHANRAREDLGYRYFRPERGLEGPVPRVSTRTGESGPRRPRVGLVRREATSSLDRTAMDLENQLIAAEERLLLAGRSPAQIAAALNARFNQNVTADDIANGDVWWRIGRMSDTEFGVGGVSFEDWMPGRRID